jgi:hypothetical protein
MSGAVWRNLGARPRPWILRYGVTVVSVGGALLFSTARGEAPQDTTRAGPAAGASTDSSAGRERSSYERTLARGGDRPQGDC